MIKVENIKAYNITRAVYSARNAMNSWNKSDSDLNKDILGPNDLELAKKLYAAGPEHRKYLRQVFVSMDITAPIFLWAEIDTYKIGVTRNSCSFMHKGISRPFTDEDFSFHNQETRLSVLCAVIDELNRLRERYLETKDPDIFAEIRELLPSGYNQRSTITMNYENAVNMIRQRKDHRLEEWREFCGILLEELPYLREIME